MPSNGGAFSEDSDNGALLSMLRADTTTQKDAGDEERDAGDEGGAGPSIEASDARGGVDLPAVYVLERHHVEEALALWAFEERSGSPVVSNESIHQWTGERSSPLDVVDPLRDVWHRWIV